MNTRKLRKFLMLLARALLLVSVTVGATVAYLTSTDEVVNTFTVGKVGLTLDELDVDNDTNTNDNKEYTDEEGEKTIRDKANAYKLIPGSTYTKDPTVHIAADSEDGVLFVEITNEILAIEGEKKIADQMTEKGWAPIAEGSNVYYYNKVVKANDNIVVFDDFTIAGTVSKETLATYTGKTVKVKAYLIQAEGFVAEGVTDVYSTVANTAWTGFSAQ